MSFPLMPKLREHFSIIVIVTVFLIVCGACLNNIIIYTPDSARYVVWAKSIANFQGFYDDTIPDPLRYVIHAPLYSVLLAPAAMLFPNSVIAAKVVTILLGSLTIVLFYFWIRGKVDKVFVALSCSVLAINPLMILYSTQVLSDVPFVACMISLFFVLEKSHQSLNKARTLTILATITSGFLLREVGLTLMMTVVAWYAIRKEYQRAFLFLAVPLLFYLLWIVRNEIIIAPLDMPAMRNSQVFLTHLFTPQQATLFEELKERIWNNFKVYKDLVGMLIFLPEFAARSYASLSRETMWVQLAYSYVSYMGIPIGFITIGLTIVGIVSEWKKSSVPRMTSLFLGFYSIPILLYPINDIRFILPVLAVLLYHVVIGFSKTIEPIRQKLSPMTAGILAWIVVALCAFPNIVWVTDHVGNNIAYSRIHSTKDPTRELNSLPVYFRRPVDLAGQFIVEHSDSSAVVGAVWKELYFWLEGRKIVELNPHINVDPFDYIIRDYGVRYLMVSEGVSGLRECEVQMAQSHRFQFKKMGSVGNLQIMQVEDKQKTKALTSSTDVNLAEASTQRNCGIESQMQDGLRLLEPDPARAETVFKDLWNTKGSFESIVFYTAVAKEFADSLEQANNMFKRFGGLPQGGSLLTQAAYHQEIIARLQAARRELNATRRAEKYHILAVNYWELGFRRRAIDMLDRSLKSDATFFPSLIFGSLYSLQIGDTIGSRNYLKRAAPFEPTNELVNGLSTMFQHFDSLKLKLQPENRERIRISIAQEYARIGLRENAIDELLFVLRENPNEVHALRLLADVYMLKRRFAPARKALARLLTLNQNDTDARTKLDEVMRHW